jgi:hypothetical protein
MTCVGLLSAYLREMNMRHLLEIDVYLNLRNGRSVEQFLSKSKYEDFPTVKFTRIDKENSGAISVSLFEVYDDGNEDFLNIYEFQPIEPDEPDGVQSSFQTAEEAVNYVCTVLGGSINKFVNAGMVQEEYKDSLVK